MRTRDPIKEKNIRDCALQLIVKEGFDGFSMQKLAKNAMVSPATLYIYYENKEHLLNELYLFWQAKFTHATLHNFKPEASLEDGLWCQWRNRWTFFSQEPIGFQFLEQFMNSPLIRNESMSMYQFRDNMRLFYLNLIERNEIEPLQPEMFWSLAYAPLYACAKFHIMGKSFCEKPFLMDELKLKTLYNQVIKSIKKQV
jgi:AcrR family transcriptional regulator